MTRLAPPMAARPSRRSATNRCRVVSQQHVPSEGTPKPRLRCKRGKSLSQAKGNENAFKHGHYAAEAIANWREIATLFAPRENRSDTGRRGPQPPDDAKVRDVTSS